MLRPYLPRMVFVVLMLLLLAAMDMVFPAAVGLLFDEVFPQRDFALLWWILVAVLGAYLLRNLFYFAGKYTAVYVGEQIGFRQRKQLFERIEVQEMAFYRRNSPGELSSRVINDSISVQRYIQNDLPKLLKSGCLFVGLTAVVYAMHWQLALVSTLVLPLHFFVFMRFKKPIKRSSKEAKQLIAHAHENLLEVLLNIQAVKGYTAEEQERRRFVKTIHRSRRSEMATRRLYVTQKVMADLLIGASTIALLGFGGYQVMRDNGMKPGEFVAFFSYVGMFYPTVIGLMKGSAKLTRASSSLDRISDVLQSTADASAASAGLARPIAGRIVLENIRFGYERDRPVLRGVSLELSAGSICVVMGPSGCGKTTLVNMIPRFLTPDAGRVLLDGADAQRFNLKHLRRRIGIAFQETFLFNTTILENLRYGRDDISLEKIIRCAKLTEAHGFISELPHGYETPLGDEGVSLSRGERQRLVLTRAVLDRPSILIMDEATASIGLEAESRIISAILDDLPDATVLITSHRPDLLRYADTAVLMNAGEVVFQGDPEQMPRQVPALAGAP